MSKEHLSVVICGHVDSGKSTLAARMLFQLGGVPEQEQGTYMSYPACPHLFLDCSTAERERGITIACKRREFLTETWRYTLIDAPGHRNCIKNMLRGASQADTAILVVPAHQLFVDTLAPEGGTRQHAQLLNFLGVNQLCVVVSKMDYEVPSFRQERFEEIKSQIQRVLLRVGWRRKFVENTPIIPVSCPPGPETNLISPCSHIMPWWTGQEVEVDGRVCRVRTLYDVLDKVFRPPARKTDAALCMPVSNKYRIPGAGDVVLGRLEEGTLQPGDQVLFLPDRGMDRNCSASAKSIEMHHERRDAAAAGDIVGVHIADLRCLPETGDVMFRACDVIGRNVLRFEAQVIFVGNGSPVKPGYCPLAFARCGHAPCRIVAIQWKMSRRSGRQAEKVEGPTSLGRKELGLCTFEPLRPFFCDTVDVTPSLSRIIFLDGNVPVLLGKVVCCHHTEAADKGGKKK